MLCFVAWQEGQQLQSQVVWRADQLHKDVTERKQELDQLRLSALAANAQRSVGDVDNDLDTVEADKAVAERAKDEILRKQGRLRCWQVPTDRPLLCKPLPCPSSLLARKITWDDQRKFPEWIQSMEEQNQPVLTGGTACCFRCAVSCSGMDY